MQAEVVMPGKLSSRIWGASWSPDPQEQPLGASLLWFLCYQGKWGLPIALYNGQNKQRKRGQDALSNYCWELLLNDSVAEF